MLGFLSPLWLAGLSALAVPVALHLWSRRGGRPIRVGSIRLLAGSPPATRRSWIIQDPWLLALRCTVLAALALALSRPFWAPSPKAPKARTLALVASEVVDRVALVDSLRRAGLAVSVLEDEAGRTPNLWTALRRADRTASPGTQFVVFAPDRLRYFAGERPTLRAQVEWHTRTAGRSEAVPRAPAARTVVVFADPARLDDARYVSAAFTAAGDATGIVAVVSNHVASADAVPGSANWIVWLSERAIPEPVLEQLRRGAVLLADAGAAKAQRHRSRILTGGPQPGDVWTARAVRATPGGAPVWMDGTGAPLLTVTSEGRGRFYRFNSRFFPAWSDLVLRPAFPMAMARLWSGADSIRATLDDRRITVSQLLPTAGVGPSESMTPGMPRHSLFIPLWIAAMFVFLLERRLSARSA